MPAWPEVSLTPDGTGQDRTDRQDRQTGQTDRTYRQYRQTGQTDRTDRQDRQTDLGIEAPSRSLKSMTGFFHNFDKN